MKDSGFSLASIFFLTAVVAIFASGVQMANTGDNRIEPEGMAVLGVLGFVVGILVGGVVGTRMDRSKAATTLAVAAGAAFGPPSLILTATAGIFPVILIGSAILFIFVWVVRLLSSRPPDEEAS